MIRRVQGGNAFSTSSVIKRIFTLASFIIYFGLICFVLFKIGKLSSDTNVVMKYSWLSMMVSFMWYAARVSNANLHLSYTTVKSSFFFALLMNAYAITFIFLKADYVPNNWVDLINQYYWWIPIMGMGVLWKFKFAVLEYKARPFFAVQKLLNSITGLLILAILVYGASFAKKFLIHHETFNYLDTTTFLGLALMLLGGLMVLVFTAIDIFYFAKYSKVENRSLRVIKLWGALLHIGPVAVWFIIKGAIMSSSANFNLAFGLKEGLLAAIAAFAVAMTLFVAFTKREAGGSSKVFLLTSTSMIVFIVLASYFFQIWWKADPYTVIVIVLASVTIIIGVNIILEPEVPKGYTFIYGLLFTAIAVYGLLLWLIQDISIKGIELPFHLYDIIFLIPVVLAIALETIALSSYWWTITRISKYSGKAVKVNLQGVKHE